MVYADGKIAWGKVKYEIWSPKDGQHFDGKAALNARAFYRMYTELPLRDRGSIITGYTIYDGQEPDSNRAWSYNPGTRRVRQRPSMAMTSRSARAASARSMTTISSTARLSATTGRSSASASSTCRTTTTA